jgi:hypothetical protein
MANKGWSAHEWLVADWAISHPLHFSWQHVRPRCTVHGEQESKMLRKHGSNGRDALWIRLPRLEGHAV